MWRPRVSTALPQSLHFRLLSFHSVSDKGKPPPGRIFPNTHTHTWSLSIMRHCSGTAGIVTHALRSIALKLHPIAAVLLRFVLIHDHHPQLSQLYSRFAIGLPAAGHAFDVAAYGSAT